jgi:hypothetical protein
VRQGEVRDGRWWDWGAWWRWYLVRPIGWHVAGLRDRYATWKIRRKSDVVR